MGCNQSKIENEESVARAKARKLRMKEAVAARNTFAASHALYVTALKNTGAALNDYGQGETTENRVPGIPTVPSEPLPPPPPAPPSYPGPEHFQNPLIRSASLPVMTQHPKEEDVPETSSRPQAASIPEEEDDETDDHEEEEEIHTESHHEEEHQHQPPPRPPPIPNRPQSPPSERPPSPPPMPSHQNEPWDFFNRLDFFAPPLHETRASIEEHEQPPPPPPPPIKKEEEEFQPPPPPAPGSRKSSATDESPSTAESHNEELLKRPPKPPESHQDHARSRSLTSNKVSEKRENMQLSVAKERVSRATGGKDLLEFLQELDDQFLRASQSGLEIVRMLEANRLHYHSNFADNKGIIDHSKHVMRVITWNASFKDSNASEEGNDNNQTEEEENHASVLDKLLAWEKKLYDEVKAGELMKIDYQRKIANLNRQKKRGKNPESLEKTKAAVKYLHTRYMVDLQAMDSTSSEIQRLRDEKLYPHLVALVAGMAKMWATMDECHKQQLAIAKQLNCFVTKAPEETTDSHYKRTKQLLNVVSDWHKCSSRLIADQKEYAMALFKWLELNLIPLDSNLRDKISSSPKSSSPRIHDLLKGWESMLEQLNDSYAQEGIKSFSNAIRKILQYQDKEREAKLKAEEAEAEFEKKSRAFMDWEQRHIRAPDDVGSMQTEGGNRDPLIEKRLAVEDLKKKMEDSKETYKKACQDTRSNSLKILQNGLAGMFQQLVNFSNECAAQYGDLTKNYPPSEK